MRKLVHQHFMESVVEKSHIQVQNAEAVQMVRDFCVRPDQHMLHPKRFSNSIIMSLGMFCVLCGGLSMLCRIADDSSVRSSDTLGADSAYGAAV